MERQYRARRGQAVVFVALTMVVLCGMAAVGVDVGMVTSKQHLLRNAASTAALDARQLFADHASPITTTNGMVWNSITASVPDGAAGVQIGLGACQPAAFGGVIGHARYTIAVNARAGQPSAAAYSTPP